MTSTASYGIEHTGWEGLDPADQMAVARCYGLAGFTPAESRTAVTAAADHAYTARREHGSIGSYLASHAAGGDAAARIVRDLPVLAAAADDGDIPGFAHAALQNGCQPHQVLRSAPAWMEDCPADEGTAIAATAADDSVTDARTLAQYLPVLQGLTPDSGVREDIYDRIVEERDKHCHTVVLAAATTPRSDLPERLETRLPLPEDPEFSRITGILPRHRDGPLKYAGACDDLESLHARTLFWPTRGEVKRELWANNGRYYGDTAIITRQGAAVGALKVGGVREEAGTPSLLGLQDVTDAAGRVRLMRGTAYQAGTGLYERAKRARREQGSFPTVEVSHLRVRPLHVAGDNRWKDRGWFRERAAAAVERIEDEVLG